MNESLPIECIGYRLRYNPNIEMEVINQSPSHILCLFDDGQKIAFKRDGYDMSDVLTKPNEVRIKEPRLFNDL